MTLPPDMPAHFHHAPTFAQVRAELARELQQRRRLYPDRVAKGRMSAPEAERQIALIAAIAADLDAVIAVAVPQRMAELNGARRHGAGTANISTGTPAATFSWSQKRNALLRELDYRTRFYPEWIAKGRLLEADAARQCAALRAMLALYDDGLTWQPDPPDCPADNRRQQWRTLAAQLAPASTQQKELAL